MNDEKKKKISIRTRHLKFENCHEWVASIQGFGDFWSQCAWRTLVDVNRYLYSNRFCERSDVFKILSREETLKLFQVVRSAHNKQFPYRIVSLFIFAYWRHVYMLCYYSC